MLKKIVLILLIVTGALVTLSLFSQERHESVVVNIEIPVRVFKGNTFIDNLSIDDFEIYEGGKLQKIAAVYLIQKTEVKKEQGEEQPLFSQ